ncbi:LysR substrate-binding domain-containing protein [Paucibacter soli]|uniref:LysR substrate-binding domain-containing protein n=1 Tax=Paucibacter soli TaxID=3133433 RepID=UPI0030AE9802
MNASTANKTRLPPLNAVRAFEAAGRLGSFVAAAEELHVTQPAIGRHIKALEDRLRLRLFERTPRGVVLTDEGRRYHEQIHAALASIAEATQEITARGQQRWLRLLVVPGLASRWLRQRLPAFCAAHPGIRVVIESNPSFVDVPPESADLGIAFGEPEEFQASAEMLLRPAIFPVCSPELLARFGPPASARALLDWPLLHENDGGWWAHWLHKCFGLRVRPSAELAYTSAGDVLDLALAGKGVALSNHLLVAADLAAGRLVRPLPQSCQLEGYVLLKPSRPLSPEARLFRAWFLGELAADPASQAS